MAAKMPTGVKEILGDIDMKQKKETREFFLEALAVSLRKETVSWEEMSMKEWRELFLIASQQQVLPLIYEAVCECPAARQWDIVGKYRKKVMHEVAVQIAKTSEFLRIYSRMVEAGAKPLVVKGMICRELYPQPDHRPSTDEDVLIPKEQFEIVHKILMDCGMRLLDPDEDIDAAHEVAYLRKEMFMYIEMHKQLFPGEAEAYGNYNHFFEGVHERAVRQEIQGVPVYTLGYTDHLLYLMCHAFKHFLVSGFGLRQVCDIALFARAHGQEIDWEWIVKCCEEIHADKLMAAVFRLGQKYLNLDMEGTGLPDTWKAMEVNERALLEDMLDGGVLGNSDMGRLHSSNITLNAVAARKKGKKVRGVVLKTVFPSLKYMSGQYKYLERYPYLLPVAWINRIWKYSQEIRKSETNTPVRSMEIGNRRIELMKEYGIVEDD